MTVYREESLWATRHVIPARIWGGKYFESYIQRGHEFHLWSYFGYWVENHRKSLHTRVIHRPSVGLSPWWMVWREIPSLLLAAALAICSLPTLSAAELRCYPSDGSLWSISDLPLSPPIAPVGVVCILMPPTWPRSGVPLLKIGGHRGINYAYSTTLGEMHSATFITIWSEEAISQVVIGFHNYRTVGTECKRGRYLVIVNLAAR